MRLSHHSIAIACGAYTQQQAQSCYLHHCKYQACCYHDTLQHQAWADHRHTGSTSVYLTFTSVLVPGLERSGTAGCADMMLTCASSMPAAEPSGDADAHSLKPLKAPLASCTLLHPLDRSRICNTTALDMYALQRNCSNAHMIDSPSTSGMSSCRKHGRDMYMLDS